MDRWLVTGANGMLGRDLVGVLRGSGEPVRSTTRVDLDITDPGSIQSQVNRFRPTIIVNCAAWTRFHEAEHAEQQAFLVNGKAVRELASICRAHSIRLIHISTDYVFDGRGRMPYPETAVTGPISAYGRSKLAGEQAVLELLPDEGTIVRTAWLYGRHGPSFVRRMIQLERNRETVDVVNDQWGQPTWSRDLAEQIVALARGATSGVFHGTSSGQTTWYDLARSTFELLGADPERVRPISTDRISGGELRPRYTVLGHGAWSRVGLRPIRSWPAALAEAFPHLVDEHG